MDQRHFELEQWYIPPPPPIPVLIICTCYLCIDTHVKGLTLSSSHFSVSHTCGTKCGVIREIATWQFSSVTLWVLGTELWPSGPLVGSTQWSLSFRDMFTHPKPWCGWFTLLKHTDSQTCRQVSFGDPTSSLRISGQVFYQLSFTDHPSPLFLFLFLFCTRLWRGTNHTTVDFL